MAVQTHMQVSERMGKASNASEGDIEQTISKRQCELTGMLCVTAYISYSFLWISWPTIECRHATISRYDRRGL